MLNHLHPSTIQKLLPHEVFDTLSASLSSPLPDPSRVFPWLYGPNHESYFKLNSNSSLSSSLSLSSNSGCSLPVSSLPKDIKNFVLLVRSCPINDPEIIADSGILKNSVHCSQILSKYDSSTLNDGNLTGRFFASNSKRFKTNSHNSSSRINTISGNHFSSPQNARDLRNFITNYLLHLNIVSDENDPLVDIIIDDVQKIGCLPIFKDISNEPFSIRSFKLQINIISTISDFIVYCFNKDHTPELNLSQGNDSSSLHNDANCCCRSVSRLLHIAQVDFQRKFPELIDQVDSQESEIDEDLATDLSVNQQSSHECETLNTYGPDIQESSNIASDNIDLDNDDVYDSTYVESDNIDFSQVLQNLRQTKSFIIEEDESGSAPASPLSDDTLLLYPMKSNNNNNNINDYVEDKVAEVSHNRKFYKTFIINNPLYILLHENQFKPIISVPLYSITGEEISITLLLNRNNESLNNDQISYKNINKSLDSSELVSFCNKFDLASFNNWEINYPSKERLEIWKISSAQQFQPGIWLGNEADFSIWKALNDNNRFPKDQVYHCEDVMTYNDKIPKYCSVHSSIFFLEDDKESLGIQSSALWGRETVNWKLLIEVHGRSRLPTLDKLYEVFSFIKSFDNSSDHSRLDTVTYENTLSLTFPSSGTFGGLGSVSIQDILTIINVCKILYFKNHDTFPALLFCPEGYTETSLLAIIYLMYSTGQPLSEVVFDLYVKYGRPFYLFSNDYKLLQELEPILLRYSPQLYPGEVNFNELEELSTHNIDLISEILIKKFGPKSEKKMVSDLKNAAENDFMSADFDFNGTKNEWFDNLVLNTSGSLLPSRILPNLYLGSLSHANCVPMLAKLRLSAIISVGETPAWLSALPPAAFTIETFGASGICSLVEIQKEKASAMPFLELFPISYALLMNDIKDDGMDCITTKLLYDDVFKFCEKYTNTDINTIANIDSNDKILVHCKVGVSRSASVVIGYLMKFLQMSLEKAYMFVRVRRLNIIIQPNLRLFYGLFKIQEELLAKRFIEEEQRLQQLESELEAQPGKLSYFIKNNDDRNIITMHAEYPVTATPEALFPFKTKNLARSSKSDDHIDYAYSSESDGSNRRRLSTPSSTGDLPMFNGNEYESVPMHSGSISESPSAMNVRLLLLSSRDRAESSSSLQSSITLDSSSEVSGVSQHVLYSDIEIGDNDDGKSFQVSDMAELPQQTVTNSPNDSVFKLSLPEPEPEPELIKKLPTEVPVITNDNDKITNNKNGHSLMTKDVALEQSKRNLKWLRTVDWVTICHQIDQLNRF